MTREYRFIAAGIVALTVIGSIAAHGALPERVPIHWNFRGEVDGYGSRLMAAALIPAIMIGLLVLFEMLPWLSPVQFKIDGFRSTYGTIVVVVLAMQAFIHAVLLLAGLGYKFDVTRIVTAATFLMLGLIGNQLGKVRRNFYVGVRVPWTLASERVWNETHRLAAWVMCGGGFVGAAFALLGFPLVSLVLLVPIVAVPIVFSLVRYKQLERRGEI